MFKNPVGTGHASQEEISGWVKKELLQPQHWVECSRTLSAPATLHRRRSP